MLGSGGVVRGRNGGQGWPGMATARSVAGAGQQRERVEPEPCTHGPAAVPATTPEDYEDVAGGAGLLALLAAPPGPGPRPPRIEAAFHCRLRRDASVERRTLHELGVYYLVSLGWGAGRERGRARGDRECAPQPDAEGAFRRGPGLNLTSGQYTAPVAGFYALAATLHVGEARHRVGDGGAARAAHR